MPQYIELKNMIAKFIKNLFNPVSWPNGISEMDQTMNDLMTISEGGFFWERGCFYLQMTCLDISKKFNCIYWLSSSYAEPKQYSKTKL